MRWPSRYERAAELNPSAAVLLPAITAAGPVAPAADHHQHLFSPAIAELLAAGSSGPQAITARDVVALLDSAGSRRALVLAVAYMYGSPARTLDDEYARVRAENDWTGGQAALYPERLRAFCSFNPLKEYALDELARCAKDPNLSHGIKLHFGNSDLQLDNPAQVGQLRRVFRAANGQRMAIVVHLRASISRNRAYGAAQDGCFSTSCCRWFPTSPCRSRTWRAPGRATTTLWPTAPRARRSRRAS